MRSKLNFVFHPFFFYETEYRNTNYIIRHLVYGFCENQHLTPKFISRYHSEAGHWALPKTQAMMMARKLEQQVKGLILDTHLQKGLLACFISKKSL